jgi:putative ABC transport system permease protein
MELHSTFNTHHSKQKKHMFKSYIIIAFRNLWRNKIFSMINMAGLTIGISVFLLILQYISAERDTNRFHKNYTELHRLVIAHKGGGADYYAPPGFAPLIKKNITGIADFVRVAEGLGSGVMNYTDANNQLKSFREEKVLYADGSFFNMFSFPLIDGSPNLDNPQTMAISETMAMKYFNTTKAAGKTIVVNNQFGKTLYTVVSVFNNMEAVSDIHADMVLSFSTLNNPANRDGNDWADPNTLESGFTNIYFQLSKGAESSNVAAQITRLAHNASPKLADETAVLQPFSALHLAPDFTYPYQTYGSLAFVTAIGTVALLILVIGWINYINLSTALGLKRAKETGIRKVLGAGRWQLAGHYFTETLVLTLCCISLALVTVQLIQPWFNAVTSKQLSLGLLYNTQTLILAASLILAGSVLSGGYVALRLSSYKPVAVLRGQQQLLPGGFSLRKGLVIFQFTVSVVFIISTIVVFRQLSFMKQSNLGMNINELIVIKGPTVSNDGQAQRNANFKNTLGSLPFISKYAASNNVPGLGYNFSTAGITRANPEKGDDKKNYSMLIMDEHYFDTYGIKFLQGRPFTQDEAEGGWNRSKKVILNEKAAKQLGFDLKQNITGNKILWGKEFEVIGVVQDYHHLSFRKPIDPIICLPSVSFSYFSLQLNTDHLQDKLAQLKTLYSQNFPGNPFDYFFADESYNQQYFAEQNLGKIFIASALIAIAIACLGLFGLAAFAAQQRTKEIGIRKVLGASVQQLVVLVSAQFLKPVGISMLLAAPLAWWIMHKWLEDFAYRVSISAWIFLLAGGIAVLIAFLTVASQALKAALTNPAKSLRTE